MAGGPAEHPAVLDAVTGASRSQDPSTVARLVAAARRLFARQGVGKTRMGQVAVEAGMVRQTAYDHVSGMDELVELALVDRAREIAWMVLDAVRGVSGDPESVLVEHLALLTEICRDDGEFRVIADALPRGPALRLLTASAHIHAIVLGCIAPTIGQVRQAGLVRDGLTDDDIASWVQTCLTPMAARVDLTSEGLRSTIRTFLVSALLAS
jgi:AcrR family transcriptional regulator